MSRGLARDGIGRRNGQLRNSSRSLGCLSEGLSEVLRVLFGERNSLREPSNEFLHIIHQTRNQVRPVGSRVPEDPCTCQVEQPYQFPITLYGETQSVRLSTKVVLGSIRGPAYTSQRRTHHGTSQNHDPAMRRGGIHYLLQQDVAQFQHPHVSLL